MSAKKTRCPFCESSFAVTSEQLSARGGHVRCGKCFQVFKADDHFVAEERLSQAASAPAFVNPSAASTAQNNADIGSVFDLLDTPPPAKNNSPVDVTLAGQSALASSKNSSGLASNNSNSNNRPALEEMSALNDFDSGMDADFERLFLGTSGDELDPSQGYATSAQSSFSATSFATPAAAPPVTPANQAVIHHNMSAAAAAPRGGIQPLFNNPAPTASSAPAMPSKSSLARVNLVLGDEFSDLFLGNRTRSFDALSKNQLADADVEKLNDAADESWAEALLNETPDPYPDILPATKSNPKTPAPVNKVPAASPAPLQSLSQAFDSLSKVPDARAPQHAHSITSSHQDALPAEDDDLLSFLDRAGATTSSSAASNKNKKRAAPALKAAPAPASHRVKQPTRAPVRWGHFLGWALLSFFMLVLLFAQYVYFNFDRLAGDVQNHQRLQTLCAAIGCRAPLLDISQIKTGKVMARRHPDQPKTITRFSLILVNKGNESQPLPALKLLLLNKGRVEAGKIVQPEDYLSGPDKRLTKLAPNNPLKVSFDIRVPRNTVDVYALDPVYE